MKEIFGLLQQEIASKGMVQKKGEGGQTNRLKISRHPLGKGRKKKSQKKTPKTARERATRESLERQKPVLAQRVRSCDKREGRRGRRLPTEWKKTNPGDKPRHEGRGGG